MIDFADEHSAYASSRSDEYVYVESSNFETILETHADTSDADVKLPLVVLGEKSCGKSAMLSNWLNKRQQRKAKDEFLFMHFAGCSPKSMSLHNLLFRLITALKKHFQLREMEVPKSEEALRWSLNRFLSAASKKKFPAKVRKISTISTTTQYNTLRPKPNTNTHSHHFPLKSNQFLSFFSRSSLSLMAPT